MRNPIIKLFTGASYQVPRMDPAMFCLQTINTPHHEIHQGDAYVCSQRTALNGFDIASPLTFYVITPNTVKWAHITILGEANTPAYWELFEDTGNILEFNVSGGVAVTPKNRNRNSTDSSGLTITIGATVMVAAAAALIATEAIMKASAGGERQEFILEQNRKYLVRATSYQDNNEGSLTLTWYEHTDLE